MSVTIQKFRQQVLRQTLFSTRQLSAAVDRLGFIQADPIRKPARAQDLILRQRVRGYRAGDLERRYANLPLEECFLFAYGFARKDLWDIMHPKPRIELSAAHREILRELKKHGPMHPRDLESHIKNRSSQVNYWGGKSRVSTMALDRLHDRGLLRIARRDSGIRIYEIAEQHSQPLSRRERYEALLLSALQAMGATTRSFLVKEIGYHGYLVGMRPDQHDVLQALIDEQRVAVDIVEGVEYISAPAIKTGRLDKQRVRILAPFDPVVRDRRRFEHLWGWPYRFEAYVPQTKRTMGHYAMPVLWQDEVIGWANAAVRDSRLSVEFGYAYERPDDEGFHAAAEAEVESLAEFLRLEEGNWHAAI